MTPFDFLESLPRLTTPKAVGDALARHAGALGFGTYAIGGLPDPANPVPTQFFLQNWPEDWAEEYFSKGYGEHDPTVRSVMNMAEPFTLSDIRAGRTGFQPSAQAIEVLDAGTRFGRGEGLIVPVFGPHGYRGMACLVGNGATPEGATRATLHMWALYAHNRMLALSTPAQRQSGQREALTNREVAVLRHARNGMADEAIADALAISVRTVRFHFANAKQKLRAHNRAEALAVAVSLHLLGA